MPGNKGFLPTLVRVGSVVQFRSAAPVISLRHTPDRGSALWPILCKAEERPGNLHDNGQVSDTPGLARFALDRAAIVACLALPSRF